MTRRPALAALAQRVQQASQAVVIDFVHQRELPAEFTARKPFAGQPVEVVAGQVGKKPVLVFTEGHGDGNEAFEVGVGSHAGIVHGFPLSPHTGRSGSTDGRKTARSRVPKANRRPAPSLLD
ncbi:hypothetical protein BO443_60264 [Burkholderia orbicola]